MLGLGLGLDKPRGLIYFQNKYSIDFDGVDDRIITDGADTVAQPTTYSFWCKASELGQNAGVFGHGADNIAAFHFNWIDSGLTRPLLYLGSGYYRFWNDTTAQDDGEWHHWVVYSDTNDITNSKLYVDGVLQTASATVSSGTTAYTESLTIGSDRQVGGNSFEGKIDEFAVYDRELTQAEITRMFNTYYTNNLIQNGDFSEIGDEEVTNGDFSQIGNEEVANGNFQQQSAELVINGDFSSESNWTGINNNGYTISNGLLHLDNTTQFTSLSQNIGASGTNIYKVEFTISNYVKGSVKIALGSNGVTVSEDGPQTVYLTPANGTALIISGQGASGTTLDIDNVSVREVGQSWEINSTAIFTDNGINITTGGYIRQDVLTSGKFYQLTYDIISYTSGNIRVYDGTDQGNIPTALGSNTFNFKAGGSLFYIQANSNPVDLVIDNVSVKEIGQGYTWGAGWSTDGTKATTDGTDTNVSGWLRQFSVLTPGKRYKATFDVDTSDSGIVLQTVDGYANIQAITGSGSKTIYFKAIGSEFSFGQLAGKSASVTNISVKEVGQHWTFGTGWSTDGTKASYDDFTTNAKLIQSLTITANKSYNVKFTISNASSYARINIGDGFGSTDYIGTNNYVNGSYDLNFTNAGTYSTFAFLAYTDGSSFDIDNIVVQQLKHSATNLLVNSGDYQSANPLITSTKSMEFDGIDDYLQLSEPFSYTNHTITGWFKFTDETADRVVFEARDTSNDGIMIYIAPDEKINYGVNNFWINSGSVLPTDKWINLTFTYNGATSKIYLDGVLANSGNAARIISTTANAKIGANFSNAAEYKGKMTEVGIYNRTLTALEVASLYNQGMPTNLLVNRNNYQSGNPTVFNTKQVDFDGVDDTLLLTDITFNAGNSIAMWVNPSEVDNYRSFFGLGTTYSYVRMKNGTESTSIEGETDTNSDHWNITASGTIFEVGKWTYMVLVWNSDKTWTMYINGVSRGTSSATTDDSMTIKYIGRGYQSENEFLGKISQVGIWNSTLTADEVSSLYNHGLPIDLTTDQAAYSSSSNLLGYWRMGSGTLDTYPLIADQTNATLGSNLVVNGTFETPVDNSQWFNFSSPTTAERSTTRAYAGSYSYHIVGDSTNDGTQAAATQFVGDYTVGDVVKITAYVYPITAYSDEIKTGVAGSSRSITSSYDVVLNEWNKIEYYVTITNTTVNYITFLIAGTAGEFYLDNVSAEIVQGNPAMMINLGGGADFSDGIKNGSPYANIVQDSDFTLTGTQAQSTNGTYWDTGAGWTIANNKATSNGTVDNLDGIPLETGKNYKATVTVSNMTTGNLSYRLGGASSNEILSISSNGEYTVYGVAGGTLLRLRSQNGFDGSVTNITISEVNTGLQGYWKMGDGTNDEYPVIYDQVDTTTEAITVRTPSTQTYTENNVTRVNDDSANSVSFTATTSGSSYALGYMADSGLLDTVGNFAVGVYKLSFRVSTSGTTFQYKTMKWYNTGTTFTATNIVEGQNTIYGIINSANNNSHFNLSASAIGQNVIISNITVDKLNGNGAFMTAMPEGNITNQYPLTKIRNYYRMGDGTLDSKFTSYPATAAPFIFQDQTSPNLAHIPTTNLETKSNTFSNWTTKVNVVPTANYIVSPDGTQNATRLQWTSGGYLFNTAQGAYPQQFTISCYAKRNYSGTQSVGFFVNGSGLVDSAWSLTNDWKRFTYTYTSTNASMIGIAGNTGADVSVFGFQIEHQSQATPYLKSDGIAAVRKSSTTNLIPYSEDFTNAAWSKNESEVVLSTITSPLDSSYAYKLQTLNNNNQSYTNVSITTVATNRYTFSAYVKKADYNYVALVGLNPVTINYFDLVNGTTFGGSTTSLTYTNISDAGNGWYRCSVTFIADTTTKFAGIYLSENGTTISLGGVADGKGVYIWGAQLEQQTQAETYAPTKGIPVTIDLFKENNYGTTQGGTIQKDVPRNS